MFSSLFLTPVDINLQGLDVAEPEFEGTIQNVTFPAGREAVLTCSVRNLGRYKVSDFEMIFNWWKTVKSRLS